jgi:hypothetical protein
MFEHYQEMVSLSRKMLEAARQSEWPLLIDLGQRRDAIEAQLRALAPQALDQAQGEQEQQIVATLLAANDQIQSLVETHLVTLQAAGGDDA